MIINEYMRGGGRSYLFKRHMILRFTNLFNGVKLENVLNSVLFCHNNLRPFFGEDTVKRN